MLSLARAQTRGAARTTRSDICLLPPEARPGHPPGARRHEGGQRQEKVGRGCPARGRAGTNRRPASSGVHDL